MSLEEISTFQLLMPDLIWDKTASTPQRIVFRTIKKRLNYSQVEYMVDFVKGSGLRKIKKIGGGFKYQFLNNNNTSLVIINTWALNLIKNIERVELKENIILKFM